MLLALALSPTPLPKMGEANQDFSSVGARLVCAQGRHTGLPLRLPSPCGRGAGSEGYSIVGFMTIKKRMMMGNNVAIPPQMAHVRLARW
jgi:hypothetical protein